MVELTIFSLVIVVLTFGFFYATIAIIALDKGDKKTARRTAEKAVRGLEKTAKGSIAALVEMSKAKKDKLPQQGQNEVNN